MKASRVLREARRRAGLTQAELAKRAGVHQPAIARIERGDVTPRVDTLDRLLEFCGEGLYAMPRAGVGIDRTLFPALRNLDTDGRVRRAGLDAQGLYKVLKDMPRARVAEGMDLFDPGDLLEALARHGVRFIVIGGMAGRAHGSPSITGDLDICFARSKDNCVNLAAALREFRPQLRGAPSGLPDVIDADFLWHGDHFTFATDAGAFDCMMTPTGVEGGFGQLDRNATDELVAGHVVRVCSLEDLIRMKRAAGRVKDRIELEILVALQEDIDKEP